MNRIILFWLFLLSLIVIFAACTPESGAEVSTPFDEAITLESWVEVDDSVSLTQSTISWETFAYELTDFDTILAGSYDGETKIQTQFATWVLENKYLKVTLLPDYGGRILSMIYKPTGHEELYQNPVGVPYQIGTKVFYHDWLMVYGGIFPTFPEPEHGKYWLHPWDFEIIKESNQEVVIAMSMVDDAENVFAPPRYKNGATGLKVTYYVSLKAGRAALDTVVLIENPGAETVAYEYWTNTTLAPGSDPTDPKTTAEAEIIAPVEMIKIPGYWSGIAAQEKAAGLNDIYEFDNLRMFENWLDMGIAYAFPDMQGANFWGVINHENREGIFRIADNTITPGMKIWTWGYPQTKSLDPYITANEARPYIELWAGVSREFWQREKLSSGGQVEFSETYSPSVGLEDVSHANTNFLVNCAVAEACLIDCQLFGMYPGQQVEATLLLGDSVLYEETFTLDPKHGNSFAVELQEGMGESVLELRLSDEQGITLFVGTVLPAAGQ